MLEVINVILLSLGITLMVSTLGILIGGIGILVGGVYSPWFYIWFWSTVTAGLSFVTLEVLINE